MSNTSPAPDHHSILDEAFDKVIGGANWLKSVFFGEFVDHRPLSALAADMLVSFVPGVVIVTSARDAVAVVLRLANDPKKRDDLMEWVLLCACLITIALPIAAALAGAAAAGAGAVVAGIAGTELGAALRAVMLLLIKEAQKLVEVVQFLQRFIKGDILKFLRAIKFSKYEKALTQALRKICGQLIEMVKALRLHLESLRYFDSIKTTIAQLAEWEKKFYAVQYAALEKIPLALAELDARLMKVLAQTLMPEAHLVPAGVAAEKALPALPARQRIRDTPGNILAKVDEKASEAPARVNRTTSGKSSRIPTRPAKTQPELLSPSPLKEKPEPAKAYDAGTNTKQQAAIEIQIVEAGSADATPTLVRSLDDLVPGGKIPSVRNGAFNDWYNKLTPEEFERVWANPEYRDVIEARIRQPGKLHEWLMVSKTDKFKRWGVSMEEIKDMRTLTSDISGANPAWVHGGEGSTTAHNEIIDLIDSSSDFGDYKTRLQIWADTRLTGGRNALPDGLKD